jgi:hypothetical protein
VDDDSQLFHTLDAFPFRERDLDKEFKDYIVDWTREVRPYSPLRLIIHLPEDEAKAKLISELRWAFYNWWPLAQRRRLCWVLAFGWTNNRD